MNEKIYQGLMNAPKEKRYRSFVNHSCDFEEVWMLLPNGCKTPFDDVSISVWPQKEFTFPFVESGMPVMLEVHDFLDACEAWCTGRECIVHVFPNGTDAYDVSARKLMEDMAEELEQLE